MNDDDDEEIDTTSGGCSAPPHGGFIWLGLSILVSLVYSPTGQLAKQSLASRPLLLYLSIFFTDISSAAHFYHHHNFFSF